jgi:hypothetical protein
VRVTREKEAGVREESFGLLAVEKMSALDI